MKVDVIALVEGLSNRFPKNITQVITYKTQSEYIIKLQVMTGIKESESVSMSINHNDDVGLLNALFSEALKQLEARVTRPKYEH